MKRIARASARDRADVFREAGEALNIAASLIEKDFWVCWTLERLFGLPDIAPHLLFKGGTSLSKVYGVIRRFSEDVDISVSRDFVRPAAPDAAEGEGVSKTRRRKEIETLVAAFHQAVAEVIRPRLYDDIAAALGELEGWELRADERDAGTLHFSYPLGVGLASPYNAPAVKIEMGGRSDVWPAQTGVVIPYAAEAASHLFDDAKVTVHALAPERTFWEKATLLHNEFYRPPEKRRGERISRHHYDLVQLAMHPEIGPRSLAARDVFARVAEHKAVYYPDSWSRYGEAVTGNLRLAPPPDLTSVLQGDYARMRPMFFDEPPAFDAIIEELSRLEAQINTTAPED
jgi:hypothetical protein